MVLITPNPIKSLTLFCRLDVEGFLSFNLALDDLFYFDDLSADEDGEEEEDEDSGDLTPEPQASVPSVPVALSVPPDTPKIEVYGILTGKDDSVEGITFDDLERWADLKAMVDEGEVEVEEVRKYQRRVSHTHTQF